MARIVFAAAFERHLKNESHDVLIMSTKNNYKKWRPGSNAAFGRNNGVPNLMRPSAAKWRPGSNAAFGRKNGVQDLMRPSAAKWHSSIF